MMTLFPFLTLQARSLGIHEDELGIIYGLMPLVALITPPLSGMLADKIGNYKVAIFSPLLNEKYFYLCELENVEHLIALLILQ